MQRFIALGMLGILVLSFSGAAPVLEEVAVARLVEEFGQNLKHVSLLAPAEVVEESMRRHYGEYVVPELLEEWILCPSKAPGRAVSSPWPDRIEVVRIIQGSNNTYEVDGEIVELTNSGEAARRAVSLVVEKWGGTWLIRKVLLLPPGQIRQIGGGEIMQLSLEEKVGQLVMVGLEGPSLDQRTRRLLRDYHVGGFIFFARNIQSPEQTLALVNSLNQANEGKLPLLLAIDEEGGRVSRLPREFVLIPANREVGQGDPAQAGRLGQLLGQRVKSLGFNVNFAPVLDIDSNPANPVIGPRSFGSDPALVAQMGIAAMQGIQDQGVAPVVKHFPGHGDTAVDSHLGLPRVEADMDRLRNFELIPFREAIRAGADMVMTAHILLPQLDPKLPATLSPVLIDGVLRQELNFDGVVITDDLNMAAIKDNYDLGQAAVLAINAGVDIVLVCHEFENYVAVLEAIRSAVLAGDIPQAKIDAAVARILELKGRYPAGGEVPTVEACNRLAREIFGD